MASFEFGNTLPRFETGGKTQRMLRGLADGALPSQLHAQEFLSQAAFTTEEMQGIDARALAEEAMPETLRNLESERLAGLNYYTSVLGYFQAHANMQIAELAVEDTQWPALRARMLEKYPQAIGHARKEISEHPSQLIDFIAVLGSLNHHAAGVAGREMDHKDPTWQAAARHARSHTHVAHGKMREIIDRVVEADPKLQAEVTSLQTQLRENRLMLGEYAGRYTQLLKERGLNVHPRVMTFETHTVMRHNPLWIHRDLEHQDLAVRISNLRSVQGIIFGYAGVLAHQGVKAPDIVPRLLQPGTLSHMASWAGKTLQRLPFSYVTGNPPETTHVFEDFLALVEQHGQNVEPRPDGSIAVPPRESIGASRGRCPVQYSMATSAENTADTLQTQSLQAGRALDEHCRLKYGTSPDLIKQAVNRDNTVYTTVHLGEMLFTNAILLSARENGPLNPDSINTILRLPHR